jgi:lysophospholipase L1-like esterase
MRKFWIVLIAVLIVVAGVSAPRVVSVSASNQKQPVAAPTPTGQVAYVAIGDGNVQGEGLANPSTESYPALLAKHLRPGARFLNLGKSGHLLNYALKSELPRALASHAPLATISLGIRDVAFGSCPGKPSSCGTEVATFKAGLRRMLSALHDTHVRVFVATLPDFHVVPLFAGGNPDYCAGRCWIPGTAINAAIVAVAARYGDPVVDVYSATRSLWGRPEFVKNYGDPPGLFLNAAGQAAQAELFYGVMHAHGALP